MSTSYVGIFKDQQLLKLAAQRAPPVRLKPIPQPLVPIEELEAVENESRPKEEEKNTRKARPRWRCRSSSRGRQRYSKEVRLSLGEAMIRFGDQCLEVRKGVTTLRLVGEGITEISEVPAEIAARCSAVLLSNNVIHEGSREWMKFQQLESLSLTQNKLNYLNDITETLITIGPKLRILALDGNGATWVPGYRARVLSLAPKLERLDGRPVSAEAVAQASARDRRDAGVWDSLVSQRRKQRLLDIYAKLASVHRQLLNRYRVSGPVVPAARVSTLVEVWTAQNDDESLALNDRRALEDIARDLAYGLASGSERYAADLSNSDEVFAALLDSQHRNYLERLAQCETSWNRPLQERPFPFGALVKQQQQQLHHQSLASSLPPQQLEPDDQAQKQKPASKQNVQKRALPRGRIIVPQQQQQQQQQQVVLQDKNNISTIRKKFHQTPQHPPKKRIKKLVVQLSGRSSTDVATASNKTLIDEAYLRPDLPLVSERPKAEAAAARRQAAADRIAERARKKSLAQEQRYRGATRRAERAAAAASGVAALAAAEAKEAAVRAIRAAVADSARRKDARNAALAARHAALCERKSLLLGLGAEVDAVVDDKERLELVLELAAMLRRATNKKSMSLLVSRVFQNWYHTANSARSTRLARRLKLGRWALYCWREFVRGAQRDLLAEKHRASTLLQRWHIFSAKRRNKILLPKTDAVLKALKSRQSLRLWHQRVVCKQSLRHKVLTLRISQYLDKWRRTIAIKKWHRMATAFGALVTFAAERKRVLNLAVLRTIENNRRYSLTRHLRSWRQATRLKYSVERLALCIRLTSALALWRQTASSIAAFEHNESKAIEFYLSRLARNFFYAWRSQRRSRLVLQKFIALCTRAAHSTARLEASLRLEKAQRDLVRRNLVNDWALRRRLAEKRRLVTITFRGWLTAVLNAIEIRRVLTRTATNRAKHRALRTWHLNACLRPQAKAVSDTTERKEEYEAQESVTELPSANENMARHAAIDAEADEKLAVAAQAQLQHTGSALNALRALEAHLQTKSIDPPTPLSAEDLEYLRKNPGQCAQTGYDRRRLAWLRSAVQDIKATTLLGLSDALAKLEEKSSDGDLHPRNETIPEEDNANFVGALKEAKRLRRRLAHTRDRIARHLERREATAGVTSVRKKSSSKKSYAVAPSTEDPSGNHKPTDLKIARLRRHTARLFNDISSTANSAYLLGLRSSPPVTLSSAEEEYLSSSSFGGGIASSSSSTNIGKTAVI